MPSATEEAHSTRDILQMLNTACAGGGNLLLNIGPTPDGSVPEEAIDPLKTVGKWLKKTPIPKLLILGEPGYLITDFGRRTTTQIPQQSVARVSGAHLLPEESPDVVGRFLRLWWQQLP